MRPVFQYAWPIVIAICSLRVLWAQDLSPRAYVITPVNYNAVTLTNSFYDGSLQLNGAVPVSDATGTYNVPILSLYHSFNLLGRSAHINAVQSYAVGTFQGNVGGGQRELYRSGLLDTTFRVSMNFIGGRAMSAEQYMKWKQRTLVGASLKVVAPTGQYDSTKLINWGANRWGFKPEVGYSKRWGKWLVDGYAGVWFYTANSQYFSIPTPKRQTERPIGSFEGHLSYDVKPRLWFSLDGNFWFGGISSLNGLENPDTKQTSSRIGLTGSIPLSKHQSMKVSYNSGTYIRFGGDYQNVSVAWQYSWVGRRSIW